MLTYTSGRNLYGKLTQDSSASNLTDGDTIINNVLREILGVQEWTFLNKTATITSVASQQFYDLPSDCIRPFNVTLTVSTTKYSPRECPSREFWDILNQSTSQTSDTPEWYFIIGGQVGFYPTLSSASNTITINYKKRFKDLSLADYTTGTVDIVTNGDETVTGSGTTWTTPMAGRWLKIAPTNVATSSGDGLWYEIDSVTSATVLELVKTYRGTSLTTGASATYTIGEVYPLPEEYHMLPIYKAVALYWMPKDEKRYISFLEMYNQMMTQFRQEYSKETTSPVIDDGGSKTILNPNIFVEI